MTYSKGFAVFCLFLAMSAAIHVEAPEYAAPLLPLRFFLTLLPEGAALCLASSP